MRFALPVLAGLLLQQLYNTVDALVAGRFGGEASLSAVGTTGSFVFLFTAIATGLSAGNGVVIAQHHGADDEEEARANASTGILLLMGLGVLAACLGVVLARPAYRYLVGVPDDYLDLTVRYFRIHALSFVFQYGYNAFASILRAVGDSAATLYYLMVSAVMNIVLDLLFVAVFSWGVEGVALSTVFSEAAAFLAAYLYMRRRYPVFRFALHEYTWSKLRAVAFINVILSTYTPLFGVFQGSNHTGIPTVVATGALGTRVLVTYPFRYSSFLGHRIIWWNGLLTLPLAPSSAGRIT